MTQPTENAREKLLPCPFCGAAFKMGQEPHDNGSVSGKWYLFHEYGPLGSAARKCLIDVRRHFDTEAEAITAWNTRPTPTEAQSVMTPLELARLFHDTYEQLAPSFGYETRDDTKQFDPNTPNGRLMTAVSATILASLNHSTEAHVDAPTEALSELQRLGQEFDATEAQSVSGEMVERVALILAAGYTIGEPWSVSDMDREIARRIIASLNHSTEAHVDAPTEAREEMADNAFFERNWFVACVSEDGQTISIDHPTDADWFAVRRAHEVLRDRLNERLGGQNDCPVYPASVVDRDGVEAENKRLFDRMTYFIECIAHADREGWNDATIDEARKIAAALSARAASDTKGERE